MNKEMRVYAIEFDSDKKYDEYSDEEFMELAEEEGLVWTLKGFEQSFNENWNTVSPDTHVIRFIEVENYN